MAELSEFGFRPGDSFFHALDVRCKLACFILISLTSLNIHLLSLLLLTLTIAGAILHIRLSFLAIFKEIRYFFLLLAFVFIARALSTPGATLAEIRFPVTLTVTEQGVYDGILVCWRLLVIVILSLVFVSTTRSSEVKAAVEWLFSPFPFIPGKRLGAMIGLLMRFIPVILNQVKETADAQRARGVENRKNPIYRLVKFVIPLMRRAFEDADKLILAMEARCYSENRTGPELAFSGKDGLAVLVMIIFIILLLTIG